MVHLPGNDKVKKVVYIMPNVAAFGHVHRTVLK
jgi:hypothetical protein